MQAPAVLMHIEDRVAVVTLNRPARLNAVDHALRTELARTLSTLNADDRVGAVVLTGAGERAFSAGQDLDEAQAMTWEGIVDWLTAQRNGYQSVRDLDKPCVAAINGVAAGAGFQIALCADERYIAADTKLGQPEVRAGLASIVGSYLMTLQVGMTHNVQMSLGGELISGQRAYEIGLVTGLAPTGQVVETAIARARDLASLPATAVRVSKQRFRAMTQAGFDEAVVAGIRAQLECYARGDPQAATKKFIEARTKKKQ